MRSFVSLAFLVSLVPAAGRVSLGGEAPGPLKAYVDKKDDSYRWVKRREGKIDGTRYVELTLTSQTWREIVWRHQLFIFAPSTLDHRTTHGLLYIGGGTWREELARPPTESQLPGEARSFGALAEIMKTPVAVLLQVPHQPIFGGLVEDQIISMTFDQYMRRPDPELPLLLPMVKSAVRAMDAVGQCAAEAWSLDVRTFTVTGASKRGWTTWLTGAVDQRATAIAPMVIDVLNLGPQMERQVAAWGDYSYKIRDYTKRDLPRRFDTPRGRALAAIVDPYSYREKLTQPKLIMIGTNDHYWPLDALNLYWEDLVGEKYVLYVPNNRHGLKDLVRVTGSLNALNQHAAAGKRLPKLSWAFDVGDRQATLKIASDLQPDKVSIWTATSATRDFRQAEWQSSPARLAEGVHVGTLDVPDSGYAAMFGEAVYETDRIPYFLSTNVRIVNAP